MQVVKDVFVGLMMVAGSVLFVSVIVGVVYWMCSDCGVPVHLVNGRCET